MTKYRESLVEARCTYVDQTEPSGISIRRLSTDEHLVVTKIKIKAGIGQGKGTKVIVRRP